MRVEKKACNAYNAIQSFSEVTLKRNSDVNISVRSMGFVSVFLLQFKDKKFPAEFSMYTTLPNCGMIDGKNKTTVQFKAYNQ